MTYWEERIATILRDNIKTSEDINKRIAKEYQRTISSIEKDISYYLNMFMEDYELNLQQAKEYLTTPQMANFKRDLREYILSNSPSAETQRHIREVEAAIEVTRLQAAQYEVRKNLETLFEKINDHTEQMMAAAYENTFLKTAYELAKFEGPKLIQQIPRKKLEKIIKTPWLNDNLNFSDRIWENKEKLARELEGALLQMTTRGEPLQSVSETLAGRMEVSLNQARTLIHTENAFISNEAMHEAYLQSLADGYQIVATLDGRTSEQCRDQDGKIYKFEEKVVGVTAPPFHPNCRTVEVAYYENDYGLGKTRMARDPVTGKSVRVDNMSYREWEDKYLQKEIPIEEEVELPDIEEEIKLSKPKKEVKPPKPKKADIEQFDYSSYKYIKGPDEDPSYYAVKDFGKTDSASLKELMLIYEEFDGYIGTGNAFGINDFLRAGGKDADFLSAKSHETIKILNKLIDNNVTHDNVIAERYVGPRWINNFLGKDTFDEESSIKEMFESVKDLKGKKYIEKAFSSASIDTKSNVFTERPIKMELYIPKGTHAFATENYEESEIILGLETEFELLDMEEDELDDRLIMKFLVKGAKK